MLEIQLPIKKYQTIAGFAAVVGFVVGVAVPVFAFVTGRWLCPFGDGLLGIGGFALLTGVIGAALIGNGVAFLLILIAKWRHSPPSNSSQKRNI